MHCLIGVSVLAYMHRIVHEFVHELSVVCGCDKELSHTIAVKESKLNVLCQNGCVFMGTLIDSAHLSLGPMLIALWC